MCVDMDVVLPPLDPDLVPVTLRLAEYHALLLVPVERRGCYTVISIRSPSLIVV